MSVAPNPSDQGNTRNDPIHIIIEMARHYHIPPALALSIAAHESGFDTRAIGDNGHSVGLFQLYDQGEGAGRSVKWREDARNNARVALRVVANVYHAHPNEDWGTIAAAAQRPADRAAYAQSINDIARRAGRGSDAVHYFTTSYAEGSRQNYSVPADSARPATGGNNHPAGGGQDPGVPNNLSNGGGGGSSGGGGGGGAGGASSNISPVETVADFKAGLSAAGFAFSLIQSDPTLRRVFQQAITQGWYKSDTGLSRFQAAIRNTRWWQSRSVSQRNFDELRYSDPREFHNEISQKADGLQAQAAAMGVNLVGGDLGQLSRLALRNGMTDQEVASALAGHFHYNPNGNYTGTSGSAINQVQQMASDYYVPVSNHQMTQWVQQVDAGALDPNSLQEHFKQAALSMFPYLQKQLNGGQTVASIADQYKQLMANTLEIDQSGIKNQDPTVMKGLQTKDPGTGEMGLMPLWQYQQSLKEDPRWLATNNARDSLMDVGTNLLKTWGVIA